MSLVKATFDDVTIEDLFSLYADGIKLEGELCGGWMRG